MLLQPLFVRVCGLVAAAMLPMSLLLAQQPAANAPQKDAKPGAAPAQEAPKKEPMQLQVFQLKHAKPAEILGLISAMNQSPPANAPGQPTSGQSTSVQTPFLSAGGLSSGGGPSPTGGDLRIATDEESKTLFVRGPKAKIDQIKEVIAAFDAPLDKIGNKEFNGKIIVPLPKEKASRVQTIFQQLDLGVRTFNLGDNQLLIIQADQKEIVEQAKQVMAAFESTEKPAEANKDEKPAGN